MSWMKSMRRLGCPAGWKLTRAISAGLDPRVARHIARCDRCLDEYQALRQLTETARVACPIPDKMTREARETIGARLRGAGSPPQSLPTLNPPRRQSLWVVAAPTAAVVILAVMWGIGRRYDSRPGVHATSSPSALSHASVRAIGHARFSRVQAQPDEIVRVDEGELELDVAPLHANERFRVVTDDGEVEVRGTSFRVSVSQHLLVAVHVWRGRVEVRSRAGVFALLEAGDGWERDVVAAGQPRATAPVDPPVARPQSPPSVRAGAGAGRAVIAAPPRPVGHAPNRIALARASALEAKPTKVASRAERPASPPAASFSHAWSLLRSGDAKAAAAELAEVEQLSRGRDLEEDVLYWRAVAVGRTGDAAGARDLLALFLDRFPASARAGEAAAALGELLLDAGHPRAAHRAFERAEIDPSPRVRARALEGLRRAQAVDNASPDPVR